MALQTELASWLEQARVKQRNGGIVENDLDALAVIVHASAQTVRQRLLYLHAATPSIRSKVIGMALHEPVPGSITDITSVPADWPFDTVHDAILAGWQVIHFPQQRAFFDDREIDILGYEFILQKLETYDAENDR